MRRVLSPRVLSPLLCAAALTVLTACAATPMYNGTSLAALDGTSWLLTELGSTPAPDADTPDLSIEGERISGSTGCNRYFGTLDDRGGGAIDIGQLGSTRRACPGPQMDVEADFLAALQEADRLELSASGTSLRLMGPLNGDRPASLTFRRVD